MARKRLHFERFLQHLRQATQRADELAMHLNALDKEGRASIDAGEVPDDMQSVKDSLCSLGGMAADVASARDAFRMMLKNLALARADINDGSK